MAIIVVPETGDKEIFEHNLYKLESQIFRAMPQAKMCNLYSWGKLSAEVAKATKPLSLMEIMVLGMETIIKLDDLDRYDIFIGAVSAEHLPKADSIIFLNEWSHYIYTDYYSDFKLPESGDIVILGDDDQVEHELYKRTIIYNIVNRE